MKKIVILLLTIVVMNVATKAQTISLNGYGGYLFGDNLNYGTFTANIQGSGVWGASIEGMNQYGNGIELLYHQQNTQVPIKGYPGGNTINPGANSAVLSYILLNFERYFNVGEKVMPYGALGLGVLLTAPQQGSGYSYFAWDAKMGVKIKTAGKLGFKIQAQLLSATAASGTAWYYGYVYTTYSTLWQFGFEGGITLDFSK
ncbi:MAG: hypothetical protein ACHQEM_06325 [Chitinophagales bacterium]